MSISELVSNLFSLLRNLFNPLFTQLFSFFTPVVIALTSVAGIISFLLGALADPQGWMNSVVVSVIDFVAVLWPSTPENLKIGSLLTSASETFPAFGTAIIADIFESVLIILGLVAAVKIYKLLPFKAS